MDEAEQKKKRNKRILLILFIALNAAVIAWTAFSEFQGTEGAEKFQNVKVRAEYLIPAAVLMVLAVVFETAKYAVVMKKTCGYVKWKLCRRTVLYGRYYDNITPSGIGGQPFQIYYLAKNGVPNGESAAITIAGFLSMQFSFILLALLTGIFGRDLIESDVVRVASYVGMLFYSLFPVLILFFTFFPAFSEKLTRGVVSLLAFLRLVKNKEERSESFIRNVEGYSTSLREFIKNGWTCAVVMALGLLYQIALCSVPYFVILAFGGEISFLSCFVTIVTIYAAITFIPTPGNAGAAEGVFYAVFSVLTSGYIFWAMLTWRILVYYAYIGIGIFLTVLESIEKKRAVKGETA